MGGGKVGGNSTGFGSFDQPSPFAVGAGLRIPTTPPGINGTPFTGIAGLSEGNPPSPFGKEKSLQDELAEEAEKVDNRAALSKAITLLDAKIAAVQPLSLVDDDAKLELLEFTNKRRSLCEQVTLL